MTTMASSRLSIDDTITVGDDASSLKKHNTSSFARLPGESHDDENDSKDGGRGWLLLCSVLCYVALITFAWVGTVVLSFKPVNHPRWATSPADFKEFSCQVESPNNNRLGMQCGGPHDAMPMSPHDINVNDRYRTAVRVANYIAALLALPFTSAICARAAVVHVQRQESSLTLRQTLALADRGWASLSTLRWMTGLKGGRKWLSPFLVLAGVVCALGALPWPLQGIFVSQSPIDVWTFPGNPDLLSFDADITGLTQGPSSVVINSVAASLASGTWADAQSHLWQEPSYSCNGTEPWWMQCYNVTATGDYYYADLGPLSGMGSFVTAFPNTASSGLVQEHGFRLNSSVSCSMLSQDALPAPDSSQLAFEQISSTAIPGSSDVFEVRVGVTGNMSASPWSMTRNRQDIEETMLIYANEVAARLITRNSSADAVSMQCTATTTSGYFEVASLHNKKTHGPLLDTFNLTEGWVDDMDPAEYVYHHDNSFGPGGHFLGILGEPSTVPNASLTPTLGPLLTSMRALFGPGTWASTRMNATFSNSSTDNANGASNLSCNFLDSVPMQQLLVRGEGAEEFLTLGLPLCSSPAPSTYFNDLSTWLQAFFNSTLAAETSLTVGLFYANEASLAQASVTAPWRRGIWTFSGTQTQKYDVSLWAVIVISCIFGLYLGGLIFLAFYAVSTTTWTDSLDGWALLRMGAHLHERGEHKLPLLIRASSDVDEALDHVQKWPSHDKSEKTVTRYEGSWWR